MDNMFVFVKADLPTSIQTSRKTICMSPGSSSGRGERDVPDF